MEREREKDKKRDEEREMKGDMNRLVLWNMVAVYG